MGVPLGMLAASSRAVEQAVVAWRTNTGEPGAQERDGAARALGEARVARETSWGRSSIGENTVLLALVTSLAYIWWLRRRQRR